MEKIPVKNKFQSTGREHIHKREIRILEALWCSCIDDFVRRQVLQNKVMVLKNNIEKFSVEKVFKIYRKMTNEEKNDLKNRDIVEFIRMWENCKKCRPCLSTIEIHNLTGFDPASIRKYISILWKKELINRILINDPVYYLDTKTLRYCLSSKTIHFLAGIDDIPYEEQLKIRNKKGGDALREIEGQIFIKSLKLLKNMGLTEERTSFDPNFTYPVIIGPNLEWPQSIDELYCINEQGLEKLGIDSFGGVHFFSYGYKWSITDDRFENVIEYPIPKSMRAKKPGRKKEVGRRGKKMKK